MPIEIFQFENTIYNLKISPIAFSELSLLVGASGVGKTQILQSIAALKAIANGKALHGVNWEVSFSNTAGDRYVWQGAFEKNPKDRKIPGIFDHLIREEALFEYLFESKGAPNQPLLDAPRIAFEALSINDQPIVERKGNDIVFKNSKTPKLSSDKSILNLFREEDSVANAYHIINRIVQGGEYYSKSIFMESEFDKVQRKYPTLEAIRNSYQTTPIKLALAYRNAPETFNMIKAQFKAIFPQVEEMKMEPLEKPYLPSFFQNILILRIKEKNVSDWIFQNQMSSGMYKTLMHLSELYLCAEGTVVLIDEFENSLGINCIDAVVENLINDDRGIQFIITSHHPYIINAVGMAHWKIVSRNGGVISAKDARDFNLGRSRHKAFKQLLQLDEYKEGINV